MMSQFYNNFKTAVFLGALTALVLIIGRLFGPSGLWIALILAAVMNFVAFFFSDKIAIMTMRGQEVGPDHILYRIVADLAQRADLPMPRVYVSPIQAPNAFATGRSPRNAAVCATQGLLDMLEPNEVAGVMAHELAHVKHRDILITTVAATIGAAISTLAYMRFWGGGRDNDHPLLGLATLILGPMAASLIQMAISRSREYNADKEGAAIVGDPMYLATALEKIHHLNQRIPTNVSPAFNSLFIAEPSNVFRSAVDMFQTHPSLEKRLMNLIGRPSTGMI